MVFFVPQPHRSMACSASASITNLKRCGPSLPIAATPRGAHMNACFGRQTSHSGKPVQNHPPISARTTAGFDSVLKSAKSKGKKMMVIWFHFLGGSGADWEQSLKSHLANQLPSVEWYFPDAPKRPVTNYDGTITRCWFDQLEGRVVEGMGTPGLEDSVAYVHALLRQAEASGFPASSVILGGMSQGGVLALKAGLTYEHPLAGIAAISAWVPPGLAAAVRQPHTPLFLASGNIDEVVPLDIFRRGLQALQKAGCSHISQKVYPGLTHTFKPFEREDIKNFINSVIKTSPQGGYSKAAAGGSPPTIASVATPLRRFG